MYRELGPQCDGVSFFANDTFGKFVYPQPLVETFRVVAAANGWSRHVPENDISKFINMIVIEAFPPTQKGPSRDAAIYG